MRYYLPVALMTAPSATSRASVGPRDASPVSLFVRDESAISTSSRWMLGLAPWNAGSVDCVRCVGSQKLSGGGVAIGRGGNVETDAVNKLKMASTNCLISPFN